MKRKQKTGATLGVPKNDFPSTLSKKCGFPTLCTRLGPKPIRDFRDLAWNFSRAQKNPGTLLKFLTFWAWDLQGLQNGVLEPIFRDFGEKPGFPGIQVPWPGILGSWPGAHFWPLFRLSGHSWPDLARSGWPASQPGILDPSQGSNLTRSGQTLVNLGQNGESGIPHPSSDWDPGFQTGLVVVIIRLELGS